MTAVTVESYQQLLDGSISRIWGYGRAMWEGEF